ncbi:hypothetical protein D9547_15760 [Geobacillus stearothermophilus]|nr:hypothetical protein D9547_15760 [Geobacillus stearothermophilus]
MDESMRHDISLFRYGLIAPLVNGQVEPKTYLKDLFLFWPGGHIYRGSCGSSSTALSTSGSSCETGGGRWRRKSWRATSNIGGNRPGRSIRSSLHRR